METTRATQEGTEAPKNSAEEQGGTVDSGKHQATEPASGQCTTEAILSPATVRAMKRIHSGETINLPQEWTVKITWPKVVVEKLQAFISTGDHENLVELLRDFPLALQHSIVIAEIRHLSQLARKITYEEFEAGAPKWSLWVDFSDYKEEEVVTVETKTAARDALRRLLEAMVQGTLPGFTVSPAKSGNRPGSPGTWHAADVGLITSTYHDLLQRIEQLPQDQRRRQPGETPGAFRTRVATVVQNLHSDASAWQLAYRKYLVKGPVRPVEVVNDPGSEWRCVTMSTELFPLAEDAAEDIAGHATPGQNPWRISPKLLVRALLAHYLDLTEDTIRGLIARAEKKEFSTES